MSDRAFRRVAGVSPVAVVGLICLVAISSCTGDNSGGVAATTAPTTVASTTVAITIPSSTTTLATTTTRGVRELSLLEALEAGLVEVDFRGTGSASGDIVQLAIRLTTASDDVVRLTVAAGMMLTNSSGGEQDLVIRSLTGVMTGEVTYQAATAIELPDLEWRDYVLEAYCAEAHDDNPTADGVLTPNGLGDERLIRVFAAIDESEVLPDLYVIQAVVWAITDDIRASELENVGYGLDEAGLTMARDIIELAGFAPGEFRLFG